MHRMTLELDDDDFRDITAELDRRTARDLPDGKSNTVGAHVAEIVRDYVELNDVWQSEHPRKAGV